jgi:ATP-dependent helicase HrpB
MTDQVRAIEPADRQKVVLSTNVAESSVTIEGVAAVVDSGLARVAAHSPFTGLPSLKVAKISRASAMQRAGRAGRMREGRVIRLYTRGDFLARSEHDAPEIVRADLAETRLLLVGAGVPKSEPLAWLTPPPSAHIAAADELLSLLSVFDADGALSPIGRRMLELPLHPRLARILVEGERRGVGESAALLAALVQERDLRLSARTDLHGRGPAADTATGPSDLLELMDAFELARSLGFDRRRLQNHGLDARSAEAVSRSEKQLVRLLRRAQHAPATIRSTSSDLKSERIEAELLICILSGFVDRLARRRKPGSLELVLATGKSARLSPNSVVRNEELLVAVDVEERSIRGASGEANVRLASAVRPEWLLDAYADRLSLTDELVWNASSERVERVSRMAFGAVVLDDTRSAAPASPEATQVLARAIESIGAQEFLRNSAISELTERLALVRRHCPNAPLPALDESGLHAVVLALADGRCSFRELRELDLGFALEQSLGSQAVRCLEREAPRNLRLPGGRSIPVHYEPGKPPWVESRLQDFFGMAEGPALCAGKVPVTLHLLAPNARAVQVTTDLKGFWERHYPGIRRELCRRYPRHPWPEDGRHAEPPKPRPRS